MALWLLLSCLVMTPIANGRGFYPITQIIEQITTVKQSIKHLVPDLNHLDRVLEDLRSENFLAF